MRWAGGSVAPGAQFSFVPLVRLGDKKRKKKSKILFFWPFCIFFNFLLPTDKSKLRDKLLCSPWADVTSGRATWEKSISGV